MERLEDGFEAPQSFRAPKRRKLDEIHDSVHGPSGVTPSTALSHSDYTVAWICALPLEMTAAKAMLDEVHPNLPTSEHDHNAYTLGQMCGHNVAVACMPSGVYGTTSAATVAHNMMLTFKSIRCTLMVGIGGGAPSQQADIRLGDVVVSKPSGRWGGVVQYDYGKTVQDGVSEPTGTLNKPHEMLLTAVSKLQADHHLRLSRIPDYLSEIERKYPLATAESFYSAPKQDFLFEANYEHRGCQDTCEHCDLNRTIRRTPRAEVIPRVHYGLVASGNQVMKHAGTRDRLAQKLGILCFEMEAAGLMDHFHPLVIRGICDYADSHKHKQWQPYAAATAAAYAKEILSVIPTTRISETLTTRNKRSVPNEAQTRQLLNSLRFDQINARHMNIKNAHARTCTWLLGKTEYLCWLDPNKLSQHHGFLWIKGKPGAGKSTLMKFALTEAKKSMKDKIIISYFFNARGHSLERSTIGMYRSLLLQLLERHPTLQIGLECLALAVEEGESFDWTIEPLKKLFLEAIKGLGQSSLVCFIDALDECDEDQVRDLVAFFQTLGELAISTRTQFRVCFASRHYPHISITRGLDMDLEGQIGHNQDIADFINSELRIGHTELAKHIRSQLQEKSSGVFMWVVLVVDILNKEHDEGRTTRRLEQKLKDIPSDLHELFRDLLTRDSRNKNELLFCIQWLLFARQPLIPKQLYYGILSGTEPEDLLELNPGETSIDAIRRFILNSSKGLAEITKSKPPTVQFIHESVRDFLLKENGLGEVWSVHKDSFRAESHERLKQCCLNYIDFSGINSLITNSQRPKVDLRRLSINRKFPFLEYAVRNVLFHANIAEAGRIHQENFLRTFPIQKWVAIDNLLEKHEIRKHNSDVSLLYILAENDMSHLIRIHPSNLLCFKEEDERYGLPIFAALATCSNEAVQTLLEIQANTQPATSPLRTKCEQYFHHGNKRITLGRSFNFSRCGGALSFLAEQGDELLLILLLASAELTIEPTSNCGRTPLSWAAGHGLEAAVRLLLEKGANLESRDNKAKTPLSWAAHYGHTAVVKLLLEMDADLESKDNEGRTPLLWAARNGHTDVVNLLLEKGADLESKDIKGKTPLLRAVRYKHTDLVNLLLEKGADLESKDIEGKTPLLLAARYGHTDVVNLLLEKGADLESNDSEGRTPLSQAVAAGYELTVELLFQDGTNTETKNVPQWTPLLQMMTAGHMAVVKFLLEKGADLESKDNEGRTPLLRAVITGHEGIVKLLLEKGADLESKDNEGRTPLLRAVITGHEAMVKLLLDKGADFESKDIKGETPLAQAAIHEHEGVVKLLLKKGANPESVDRRLLWPVIRWVSVSTEGSGI